MKLSIVVPCYNEEKNIKLFYDKIYETFLKKKIEYEIVFVNDGSNDNTKEELNKLEKEKKQNVKIIHFSRNFGKEAAMLAGLKETIGELVTIIDADLQQNPKYILQMMDILDKNEEYSSVACFQKQRKESGVLSFFKRSFYKLINKMSTIEFVNGASDFRLFKRKMVDAILQMSEYHRFSKGIFSFVGFRTYYLEYDVEERASGSSKWNFKKLFNYALEGIIGYTTVPLRFSFYLSFLFFIVTLVILICSIITKFVLGKVILLFISLIAALLFLTLGILGEYLAKVYMETKNRPVYIVEDRKTFKKEK